MSADTRMATWVTDCPGWCIGGHDVSGALHRHGALVGDDVELSLSTRESWLTVGVGQNEGVSVPSVVLLVDDGGPGNELELTRSEAETLAVTLLLAVGLTQ
ncbi:hypothetical protein [Amycolatopsis sp. H20-H5]|uniref:hypothetical protein n=1 Tax=Amycolatopsis sp. H20-H5 TaxID=3046309 RepID=UPI002DB5DA9E|nr:hypothetical protein [Amycolatopsis sp. H20-H5]MEC3974755.1 hypothetical protein [Amycolatopsis sp. H20-H5]